MIDMSPHMRRKNPDSVTVTMIISCPEVRWSVINDEISVARMNLMNIRLMRRTNLNWSVRLTWSSSLRPQRRPAGWTCIWSDRRSAWRRTVRRTSRTRRYIIIAWLGWRADITRRLFLFRRSCHRWSYLSRCSRRRSALYRWPVRCRTCHCGAWFTFIGRSCCQTI